VSAAESPVPAPAFAPRAILALVLVSIVAFAGLAVLATFAPELRSGHDGRAHALSKSAIGYAGAPILMEALGAPASVSRLKRSRPTTALVVLTPDIGLSAKDLQTFPKGRLTLIVLPKWIVQPDPLRQGHVRKVTMVEDPGFQALLASYATTTKMAKRAGRTVPRLRGAGGPFDGSTNFLLGPIDRFRTISGDGWEPLLTDGRGAAVLVRSRKTPSIWVLADPDLLNNQGLGSLDTARAGAAILEAARDGDQSIVFDVTLNGFERGRGLARLMLEPPWLAATLIAVAAGVLMGMHSLTRFGQPRARGRPFALGARALVDNSADLVRMARKEHELAPAYAALTRALVERAAGGRIDPTWLDETARRRGAAAPGDLAADAARAKGRDDTLAIARKLYDWRGEMTRERR